MLQFFDSIKHKKIVIFGAGGGGKNFKEKFSIPVSFYVDNAAEKWDTEFAGSVIKSPEILKQEDRDHLLILIASMYSEQISKQLEQYGFKKDIHFFCASELFINPLNLPMEKVLCREVKEIGNKISKMLTLGYTEDVNVLLKEYEEFAPLDSRIQLFYNLIALYNKDKEAARRLKEYIENSPCNLDVHYNYYCAMRLEEEGEYLKALEMYEMMLAQADNPRTKNTIVTKISELEKLYSTEIKKQLKIWKNSIIQHEDGIYHLHLMFDSFYSKAFIEFVNENFNSAEHIYLVFTWKDKLEHVEPEKYFNIKIIDMSKAEREVYALEILGWIERSKKVFIHYMFDLYCWLFCRYKITKKICWILWGGDLYSHININLYHEATQEFMNKQLNPSNLDSFHAQEYLLYRKALIRKCSYILTFTKSDYVLARENFLTEAELKPFFYPNLVNVKVPNNIALDPKYDFKKKYDNVFLLGNSGSAENNHLEILNMMKRWMNYNFCVVVPLSYGDPAYIKELIKEGKSILGDRFIPLTDFLELDTYAGVMNQIDVVFMNHNRQQGLGNILLALYLEKKVYMNLSVTTYSLLKESGMKVHNINDLKEETFEQIVFLDEKNKATNKKAFVEFFGKEAIQKSIQDSFNL